MLTNHKIHVTSEKFAREAFILMSILGNLPFLTLFLITQAVWKLALALSIMIFVIQKPYDYFS